MKFDVKIHYSGFNTYLVEAADEATAEEIARKRYMNGDNGEDTASETEDITVVDVDKMP